MTQDATPLPVRPCPLCAGHATHKRAGLVTRVFCDRCGAHAFSLRALEQVIPQLSEEQRADAARKLSLVARVSRPQLWNEVSFRWLLSCPLEEVQSELVEQPPLLGWA